jgi:hypothetical protein
LVHAPVPRVIKALIDELIKALDPDQRSLQLRASLITGSQCVVVCTLQEPELQPTPLGSGLVRLGSCKRRRLKLNLSSSNQIRLVCNY